jgi:hypothetical protein
MSTRTKIIYGALGAGVALAAAYFIFFPKGAGTSAISTDNAPASAAEIQFLNLASQVGPVFFDVSILSDPRFTSLVDIHTPILPEVAGRRDPFAPLQ